MGVDGAVAAVQRLAPHPVHQLRARQHRAGALQQRCQQAVFVAGEVEQLPAVADALAFGVLLERADALPARRGGLRRRRSATRTRATSSRGENGLAM